MSLVRQEMLSSHAAMRGVSQGAAITLVAASGGYKAIMDCATRCVAILGTKHYNEDDVRPVFLIPTEEIHRSITKLAESYSVALVDTVTEDTGTRFVLVWRIAPKDESLGETKEVAAVGAGQNLLPDLLDEY